MPPLKSTIRFKLLNQADQIWNLLQDLQSIGKYVYKLSTHSRAD